jgi:hypothetical protein
MSGGQATLRNMLYAALADIRTGGFTINKDEFNALKRNKEINGIVSTTAGEYWNELCAIDTKVNASLNAISFEDLKLIIREIHASRTIDESKVWSRSSNPILPKIVTEPANPSVAEVLAGVTSKESPLSFIKTADISHDTYSTKVDSRDIMELDAHLSVVGRKYGNDPIVQNALDAFSKIKNNQVER